MNNSFKINQIKKYQFETAVHVQLVQQLGVVLLFDEMIPFHANISHKNIILFNDTL